jgi:CYTH domain-containing protein
MGKEIERKFLVDHNSWAHVDKPEGELYVQGYLATNKAIEVRVRITPSSACLTIKGEAVGATRPEFEYEIPRTDAQEMLAKLSESTVTKLRYKLSLGQQTWEIDEYLNDNQGLITAEVELTSEDESFELPNWIDKEITEDKKFSNAHLAAKPFNKW